MFKKIFSLGITLVMAFSLVACGGAKSAETIEGDFSLAVSVKKTRMSLDDTITMTLKNLSGKDIPIKTYNGRMTELEHVMVPIIFPYPEAIGFGLADDELGYEFILEKDATIQRTVTLGDATWVWEPGKGKRVLVVHVVFYVGDGYSELIFLETNGINERILIDVK